MEVHQAARRGPSGFHWLSGACGQGWRPPGPPDGGHGDVVGEGHGVEGLLPLEAPGQLQEAAHQGAWAPHTRAQHLPCSSRWCSCRCRCRWSGSQSRTPERRARGRVTWKVVELSTPVPRNQVHTVSALCRYWLPAPSLVGAFPYRAGGFMINPPPQT